MAKSQKNSFVTWLVTLPKRWFIEGLSSMAFGLFASLLIGTIIAQLGQIKVLSFLEEFGTIAKNTHVVGAAIGVAIAYGMKSKPLVIFACATVGAYGNVLGGPVGAYIASIFAAEIGNLIAGRTKLDIILVPFVCILVGGAVGKLAGPYLSMFMSWLGSVINNATELQPIPMGIAVSVLTGMALTAPISSAALCISMGIDGMAAGAATIGCCVNMLGFAIMSYRDNGIGGFLAQGLGTSMLQVPNIIRKPIIWLPPIIASAILGPVATTLIPIFNNPLGAGMGTSGLVGPINSFIVMTSAESMAAVGAEALSPLMALFRIGVLEIVLPLALTYAIYECFRKLGWIKDGDMVLESTRKTR